MPWFLALFVIDHLVNVGDIQDTDRYYGHCSVAVDRGDRKFLKQSMQTESSFVMSSQYIH